MRVLILTLGTRGDVQPYVALGRGLRARGYEVTLATSAAFADMVRAHGLEFAALRGEFLELLQTAEGKAAVAGRGNPLAMLRTVMPMLRRVLDDEWSVAGNADLVIYHPKALGGQSIAEKLGVEGILALPAPLYSPTRSFPSPILPVATLGAPLNRVSHRLMVRLASASTRGLVNRWRREALGLPRSGDDLVLHGRPVLRLYGYSPAVVPTPDDWDQHTIATGYWFLDSADWQPPESLVAFLEAGPPPVYVGFGSMPSQAAAAKSRIVLDALARARQRGVLATGWGGLSVGDMPPDVYLLDAAPHDWLFPRMAAAVHHGGAGTTAASLRAGIPTLICPFFGDQPFWGRRVAQLGVGPQPIRQRRLSVDRLSGAINTMVNDRAMQARAASLGAVIRAEDGVGRAVAAIESRIGAA